MASPLSNRCSHASKSKPFNFLSRRFYSSINCNTQYNICFVRHGQSTWNRDNRFIGWTDTPLTEDGVLEARVAGQMLQSSGILFDEAHTVSGPFLIRDRCLFFSNSHFSLSIQTTKMKVSLAPMHPHNQFSSDGNGTGVHSSS
mmetsp:Transcript_53359/g.113363  ORF Transcript_53359/g.113363 Transcript_53359/m.113363 type:complete len:143 (-) Transcript_53359:873-1301(-)